MAKATTPTVDSLILAAGKAGDTMLAKVREAARLAAAELDTSKPLADRIAAVMTAHADAFKTAGHNVRALFSDALTLLACPFDKVEITGPKNSVTTPSAAESVDLPKHAMREAAKQVRAQHGMGRKTTPKAAAPAPAKQSTADEFRNTLADLAEHIKDAANVSALVRFFDAAGYVLAPKAATVQAPKVQRAPKVTMADLPGQQVKGAAQSASA